MESLATKYRPSTFEDVCGQKSIIKILERQLEIGDYKNCYLFAGPSGCGKTTLARIFANKINKGEGTPIEIDAASNNGVDNIREIVASAKERALDCEYKVYIIDEAHALTNQSWQAFLKCLEETPKYTIFMFCTTDPQKIPATIQNRVMRFNLTKISQNLIKQRLNDICIKEGFTNFNDSIDYISKIANGGMRDAIALLDKASCYSLDLSMNNVLDALGSFSYQDYFKLTNAIIDGDIATVINSVETCYNQGNDLKLFIENYLDFVLDLFKYCIFNNLDVIKIPREFEKEIKYTTGVENRNDYFSKFVDGVLDIKNNIRYDTNIKTTIEVMLCKLSRGV